MPISISWSPAQKEPCNLHSKFSAWVGGGVGVAVGDGVGEGDGVGVGVGVGAAHPATTNTRVKQMLTSKISPFFLIKLLLIRI